MILDVTAKAVAMQRGAVQDKDAGMIAEPKAAGREVNTDIDAAAFQPQSRRFGTVSSPSRVMPWSMPSWPSSSTPRSDRPCRQGVGDRPLRQSGP